MKIGIYNEPSVVEINGVEFACTTLGVALARRHDVELIHHVAGREHAQIAEYYGIDARELTLRYAERRKRERPRLPWSRYRAAREWHRELSEPCDLFISFTAGTPPFCRAPHGVLRVIFPLTWSPRSGGSPTAALKRAYEDWEWRRRLSTYDVKLSNSAFTAKWARRRRGVECRVVHPPARIQYEAVPKQNLILSVGRFAVGGTLKHQKELVELFCGMKDQGLGDWRFCAVGPVGDWEPAVQYFEDVRRIGAGCDAEARANVPRTELNELYGAAQIFWHAAGFGADEEREPDNMEHFGIVTVEAMAAGCVPVVIDKGGQPEIVEHGVSGFLWSTLDELREHTRRLVADEALRTRMAAAARERASRLGPDAFVRGFVEACVDSGVLPESDRDLVQAA